jgi:hypothetical protein
LKKLVGITVAPQVVFTLKELKVLVKEEVDRSPQAALGDPGAEPGGSRVLLPEVLQGGCFSKRSFSADCYRKIALNN